MSYNGWSNYETWNVALWLDNEQGSYSEMSSYASHHDVSDIAKYIENCVDEFNPIASDASLYSDLLGAALREVDYIEIAEHYYADNHEIEPETIECPECLLDVDESDYDSDLDMCHDCADNHENARLDNLHIGHSIFCPRDNKSYSAINVRFTIAL